VADESGAVVVLVEQHVHLALEIADLAMVVVHGQVVLSGAASDLAGDTERIEAAYLGAPAS
jgi:branched-chain amino acid transport system ATP-binding protein